MGGRKRRGVFLGIVSGSTVSGEGCGHIHLLVSS